MRSVRAVTVALMIALAVPPQRSGAAGIPVIDVTNLTQNTITALEVVEAVLQRVTIIQQLFDQLENMTQNTENFPAGVWDSQALPRLLELGDIIQQGDAVAYRMADIDGAFRSRWPGYVPPEDFNASYDLWTRSALDTIRGVLRSTQLQADDFLSEETRLEALQALSDTSVGRMQAIQAGNMIAAEELQQLRKLRQLMMAQSNAQTVYMANETNRQAQETASLRSWLMDGAATQIGNGLTGAGARTVPSGFARGMP
ncbi:MAG: P-type conjugative transfer protein TrbJ [Candidatus Binatia bacterium]